jgi:hypothetical protein
VGEVHGAQLRHRPYQIRISNSHDDQAIGHSTALWFETRGVAALLTMTV